MNRVLQLLSPFVLAATLAACSGPPTTGGGGSNVVVSVAPTSVSVIVSQGTVFTATVTGSTNTTVNWQVNNVAGGNATVGTISGTGAYTAPANVPTPATVTVKAISQADTTKSASASVTVVASQVNQDPQATPIKLGTSGSNANDFKNLSGGLIECCTGTLGSLVQRNGTFYILSNNHVLARSDAGALNDSIIQPGLGDNNCTSTGATVVAHLSQFSNLETNPDNVDAAIAQIVGGTVDTGGTILLLGATANGNTPNDGPPHAGSGITPSVSLAVAKSGRTTGLTCSTISAISIATQIQYEKGCGSTTTFTTTFTGQVSVAGGSFSAEGDSGSLIVSEGTADPVALLYGGSDTDTVGNPVADVLQAMHDSSNNLPTFVGSASTHQVIGCTLPSIQAAKKVQAQQLVSVTAEALQKAAVARDYYAGQLLKDPYVHAMGTAVSLDHPGEAAVLLVVDPGQPRAVLPAQLDGIRTRVVPMKSTTRSGVLTGAESAALVPADEAPAFSTLSNTEVARAKAVHTAHYQELLKLQGVQGVGITSSADVPGESALMIFTVRGAKQEAIPDVIDGVRTRLRESSPFKAGLGGGARKTCVMPGAKAKSPLQGMAH